MDNTDIGIFSEEERNDIAARIEAVSAREAITPPGFPLRGGTRRRGLFPLFVNGGAVLLLGAGLFLLMSVQRDTAAEIRSSDTEWGITERALIREIRREADSRLDEKEAAIDTMNRRIAEVDTELARLDSLEALTDEQRAAMEELRSQQETYRANLAQLQTDRARILIEARIREDEARQREASLHARIEEQAGALDTLSARSRADIEAAREELAKLSGEADRAALIERQLSGYYTAISRHIQAGQYREAADSTAALREFLATPAFQNMKAVQNRRESDAAAVNALAALITEASTLQRDGLAAGTSQGGTAAAETAMPYPTMSYPTQPPVPPGAGAEAALRQQVAAQTAALAERSAALADREKALAEVQKTLSDVQERNAAVLQTIAERDRQLENLRAQNTAYAQTIDTLQKTISNINAALENRN